MKTRIQGSLVAIVTPMTERGTLDLRTFDRLLDWHIESGTDAIVVVGTTGESATLSPAEHCELVSHCVSYVNHRIPVVAGTGSNNTREALEFTSDAVNSGADAVLLVTPYYTRPSQEGLYQHFKVIAESVDLPQILYNVPGRTACDLSFETIARLTEFDNIVGIKDATGDLETGLRLTEAYGDRLAIYSGEDGLSRELILAGADGTISVTANVAPSLMSQMCAAALAGDQAQAEQLDGSLTLLHESLFLEGNPVPVKWALAQMGMISPALRLPLVELSSRHHAQISNALAAAGIEINLNV
ncbi:MAG: 4-hydroxy-tetrahydrodipicolinate synthase [Pseudomonadota bacterium]|nr:4-hydroxy-tetrahydrodipicolinate synthase [Pseudomonadota bacterium]